MCLHIPFGYTRHSKDRPIAIWNDLLLVFLTLEFYVQVGRMGYVPAYGGNGNSRNVSCSKPSLHCLKCPWEGALYKWLTKMKYINELHKAPLALCKWRIIN